jgi:amino acid adenylation domain-containing protein/non-ribosomal peptide synthase protein (TIGR01720 family)
VTALADRVAALSPEKRRLLERRLAEAGLDRRPEGSRAIPRRAAGPGPWPLTYGQRRLWFIDRLNPGSPAYNIPFAGRLAGPLDAALLARSLREVARRHAVVRSRFVERDGEPVQVVDPEPRLRLPVVDLAGLAEAARDAEAERLTNADPQLAFDLARGPVARLTLLRLAVLLHDLLVTMPHIVTDAWSMAVLFRELPVLYDAYRRGRPSPLPELPVQVADYALWERERLGGVGEDGRAGGRLAGELDFWRRHLAGAPAVLELPADRPRPPVQSLRGIRRPVRVPTATAERLDALADGEGATSFMALLASFAAVLGRWTGQDDLLVSSPLATRGEPETQGLIGFFIDHAVLRADLSGDPSFRELLARVRGSALATFAHQGVPFEKVAEAVGAGGDLSRPPLAQVNFVLQNVHIPAPEFDQLSLVRAQQTDTRSARFDLSLGLFEAEAGIEGPVRRTVEGWLEYNTDLFDAATMARFERDWLDLLAAAVARPDAPLSGLARLRPAARQQLLREWNDTGRVFPRAAVHELVARWAERTPDAVAVEGVGEGGRPEAVTYGELAARAQDLARRLRRAGAGPKRPVAVELGRSPEQVVAFLAALEAGSCYVPLDPGLPAPRRAAMEEVARPAVVVDAGWDLRRASSIHAPSEPGEPGGEALAYVLFTSGSTGEPKGIAVPHRAVVRLVAGLDAYAPTGPDDTLLALAPASFDASTFELWGALARGARLALFPEGELTLDALERALARHRVTVLWLTAGLFHLVAEGRPRLLAPLRRLLAGGDVLAPAAVARVLRELPGLRLVNGYGPTEGTTFTTCHPVATAPPGAPIQASVPIGRPIPGTRVFVADRELRPSPLGVPGELLAGGDGLARGYHGRPAATAAAFVPDAFSGGAGARLYRTGDRVRRLPDGTLEFLGRLDRQVKVRGFRVELTEVEAALLDHPAVAAAAAVALRGGRLAAYVVPAGAAAPPAAELRELLAGRLPEYMVPAVFVPIDELPLTANGKVDREALPDPGPALAAAAGNGAPASAAEETLAAVWREVLGLERVGVHDRFFDLGGDSILAIRAISRAAEAGLHVEPRQLFEHPTIAALAAVARPAAGAAAAGGPVIGPVPLGPAQRWFLEELAPPVPDHWNLALLLAPREGALPLDRLAGGAAAILERHDLLRARFRRPGKRWLQEVVPPGGPAPAAAVDLSGLPEGRSREALDRTLASLHGSLDLARGPLFRLVRLDLPAGTAGGARLLLLVHHLVADAVSLRLLLEELARWLEAPPGGEPPLPPRTAPYGAWVTALDAWTATAEAEDELARWLARAPWAVSTSAAPAPEALAEAVEAVLPAAETAALLAAAPERLRARPDEVLIAGVAAALAEARGERQVWLEVEGHGRLLPGGLPHALDLFRTVGWFTVQYPVRVRWDAGPGEEAQAGSEQAAAVDPDAAAAVDLEAAVAAGPARVLGAVKEALRAVPAGGVGFAALRPRLPAPALSFNYLGRLDEALGAGAPFRLALEPTGPLRHPRAPRPCPLEVTAYLLEGELHAVWTYDRLHHRREEVEALAERALAVVRELATGEAALAPSDFPHAGLDGDSLARLVARLSE